MIVRIFVKNLCRRSVRRRRGLSYFDGWKETVGSVLFRYFYNASYFIMKGQKIKLIRVTVGGIRPSVYHNLAELEGKPVERYIQGSENLSAFDCRHKNLKNS